MVDQRRMRVRDDQEVRELFGNHVLGTMFDGATISFTIGAVRALPEKTGEKVENLAAPYVAVTGRVVLTPSAARELVNGLAQMLGALSGPNDPKQAN